ncbi:unnamed protein product [Onchocerca ochengi]|uniref:Transmembrane protein n=1 Tax=Onchocerca ochengi TaxID=42157 RepID=A0A182E3T0_ONCOC|nr:unnamed protein product [Onchocerca ochengi]
MAVGSRNGFRWSLNPLLVIVAFCEFCLGIGHLLFCLPLYPFLIPVIAATFAFITAFHGLFLRFPNRMDFVLHCCSAALGLILLMSSVTETFCGVDGMLNEEENDGNGHDVSSANGISMLQALCYGLAYRTSGYQKSCTDLLRPFHDSLLFKLDITYHTSSINFMTSFLLSGFALAHTVTCTALAYYSAEENGYLIRSYHGQLVVGIMMIPAALLHRFYCCTYFYLWPAVLVGKFVRLANIFGSGLAMALAAAASFGMFCTLTRFSMNHFAFQRHCNSPEFEYHYCYRVIDFRSPYTEWKREYVIAETSAIQVLINLWLCISAIVLFSLSLKSAFTIEILPGYLSTQ